MNRRTNAAKNVSFELINRGLNIAGEFFVRTLILRVLGEEFLGLNGLFSSIMVFLNLAELGFGSAITYSMYKPIAEGDTQKVNALFLLYKRIYYVVGVVVLGVGVCILPVLPYLVKGGYPAQINIYFLYVIYLANAVSGYFFGAFRASIFTAHQKGAVLAAVKSGVYFFITVLQCVLLVFIKNYYVYIIWLPVSTMLRNGIICILAAKNYPNIRGAGNLPGKERADLLRRAAGVSVYHISAAMYDYADTLIVSMFLGLALVAKYSNYTYIIFGLNLVIESIMGAIIPSVGNSVVVESKEKNARDFWALNRVSIWVTSWMAACLLCLYQPFMSIWMGAEMLLENSLLPLFALHFYTVNCTRAVAIYKSAAGIWWEDKIRPIVGTCVNFVFNIILVRYIGLYGIMFATVFTTVFITIPFAAYYLFKCYLDIDLAEYLRQQLSGFLQFIVVAASTYWVCGCIHSEHLWLVLFMRAGICVVFPNVLLWLFSVITGEWKTLYAYMRSLVQR